MNKIIYNDNSKNHRKEIIRMFDGEKLMKWLDDNNMTQYRLARLTGLKQSTVSRIISGLVDPGGRTIVKICRATGLSPNDVLIILEDSALRE